jgi:regulatory protein
MIITAIGRTPRRRGRVDLYIDGERRCDLGRELVRDRGLRPGALIDEVQLSTLVDEDARRQAMQAAIAMLARRPRSEREVRRRLTRMRMPPALIDATVAKLLSARLLDDAAFAQGWADAREAASPRGRRLIERELRALGVSGELAAGATADLSDADAAYRAGSRRARTMRDVDYATFRARLGPYLQRRGFGWDVVREAVERCWHELGHGAPDRDLAMFIE